jgi:DNA (cytosine-5)-methyltransferase 1
MVLENYTMKYLSLFSGIGGFELGIQQAYEELYNLRPNESADSKRPEELHSIKNKLQQWECVGYSEIDRYAIQVYEKHFPKHKNYGDTTKIDTRELPDFDLLVGGFPCQAFSIAGKRKGFDDTRGTLFFDIARILADKKPKHILLENVKGLLSHEGGNTFTTIIRVLTDLGYFVEWQVLNAKNFGVPQNRERVFIVGHLGGQPRQKVFPITGSNPKTVGKTLLDINQAQRVYDTDGVSIAQKALGGGQGAKTGLYAVKNVVALTEKRTEESKKIRKEMMKNGKDWSPRRGKELSERKDNLMNSLTANQSKEHFIKDLDFEESDLAIRRLTPLECERLMGFPDNWTKEVSDTQKYKMCGNAVVVNVVKEIMKLIIKH